MKPCLVVTKVRELNEVSEVLDSIDFVDKVYFIGYTEMQLRDVLNPFLKKGEYDYYIFCADDIVFEPELLKKMIDELEKFDVLTGYCRLRPNDNRLNITRTRLLGDVPTVTGYNFYRMSDIELMKKRGVKYGRTYFVGFSLSAFNRRLFSKVSYGAYKGGRFDGWGSDFYISKQLNNLGVDMWFNVEYYVNHLAKYENFIIGKVEPHVERFERKV